VNMHGFQVEGKSLLRELLLALIVLLSLSCVREEKIGILFVDVGTPEEHEIDWAVPFFGNLFDFFPPGFFAGGPLEGNDCYTLIHYANEVEAAICGVDEGTPIDAFCEEYTGTFPVHSILDHEKDGSFFTDCYPLIFPCYLIGLGTSTIDPLTEEIIEGPIVDDPQGTGIGVADFIELMSFSRMDWHYRIPDYKNPHRKMILKWWYGNDAPGYPENTPELLNIKDRLEELLPEKEFAFRHGWECYMENEDPYGNFEKIPDSTETAIDELINQEGVDRIIVYHSNSSYTNLTQYGHEWYDEKGEGISALPRKTFKECVEDINDEAGPKTQEDLDAYLENKPWDTHWKHPFPLIKHLVEEIDNSVEVNFTPPDNQFEEYGSVGLEMLNYTIAKYAIPEEASLKVILASHGYYGAYMNAQECDCYFTESKQGSERLISRIEDEFSWPGKFKVTHGPSEFSEGSDDVPTPDKPFGTVISIGEIVDASINGRYVNSMGEIVDNGTDNFDYIIIGLYLTSESSDSIYGMRSEIFGNNIYEDGNFYVRDELDADGTEFNTDDIDEEYFTVKVYDATGWPSYPGCREDPDNCTTGTPVYKGSAEKPTTVIFTGSILGNSNGIGRENRTEAAVRTIIEAIGR
jgi:hypothetical protein